VQITSVISSARGLAPGRLFVKAVAAMQLCPAARPIGVEGYLKFCDRVGLNMSSGKRSGLVVEVAA
jgi:hypothetical protein